MVQTVTKYYSNDSFLPEWTGKTSRQTLNPWTDIVTTKETNLDIDGTDANGAFQMELTPKIGFNEHDFINSKQYRENNPGNALIIYQEVDGKYIPIASLNVPTSNVNNVALRHVNTVGELEDAIDNFKIPPIVGDGLTVLGAGGDYLVEGFLGMPTMNSIEAGVTILLELASMTMIDDKKLGEVEIEVLTFHSTNPPMFAPMTSNTLFFDTYESDEELYVSDKVGETQYINYDR